VNDTHASPESPPLLTPSGYLPTLLNLSYHPIMKFLFSHGLFGNTSEDVPARNEPLPFPESEEEDSTLVKTVGWVSAGLGAVALGLFIGRELRQRYKFNRRTPYDFYAHAGDEQDVDSGLGI
jgi:hypothetical protein